MKFELALPFLFFAASATAGDSFGDRVSQAKAFEHSTAGQIYQQKLWTAIGQDTASLMKSCFPSDSDPDTRSFTFVANVLLDGSLSDIAVKPRTRMTECFSSGFSSFSLPAPADATRATKLPLVIQMGVEE